MCVPPAVPDTLPVQALVPVELDDNEFHVQPRPPRGFQPVTAWRFGLVRHFNPVTRTHTITVPGEGAKQLDLFDGWQVEFAKSADRDWHCDGVTAPGLQAHLHSACYRRKVKCRLCGAFYPGGQEKVHLEERCEERPTPCRLTGDNRDSRRGGCEAVVPFRLIYRHETEECRMRLLTCRCGSEVQACSMAEHRKRECPLRYELCPNACGQWVQQKHLAEHLETHCQRRDVVCDLGCNTTMWASELKEHREEKCSFRMVTCPNQCGQEMLARHLKPHMARQCSHRLARCPNRCLDRVVAHLMHEHLELHCEMRRVTCTLGCGASMREHERAAHELLECGHRMQVCGCGCGWLCHKVALTLLLLLVVLCVCGCVYWYVFPRHANMAASSSSS